MTATEENVEQREHREQGAKQTGIPHPDNTGRWLVPPWLADATAHELVQHFQRFRPAVHACSAIQAAYYSGYARALAITSSGDIAESQPWRWFTELLGSIGRAAASAEAEHEEALDAAQKSMQFTLVRTLGLNSLPIEGQAL
jgi:hypothetical protein